MPPPADAVLPVADIVVGDRARKDTQHHLGALVVSIERFGLLHPVVINTRNELVAGGRRLAAVKRLGWPTVPVRVVAGLDDALTALQAERDENTCREPLCITDQVALGKRIEDLEKPAARGRQKELGRTHGTPSGKLPEGSTGQTRDKVAAALGMSGKTYEKAKQVIEAAEQDPDGMGDLKAELEVPGAKVDPVHKEMKRRKERRVSRGEVRRRLASALAVLVTDPEVVVAADLVRQAIVLLDAARGDI